MDDKESIERTIIELINTLLTVQIRKLEACDLVSKLTFEETEISKQIDNLKWSLREIILGSRKASD